MRHGSLKSCFKPCEQARWPLTPYSMSSHETHSETPLGWHGFIVKSFIWSIKPLMPMIRHADLRLILLTLSVTPRGKKQLIDVKWDSKMTAGITISVSRSLQPLRNFIDLSLGHWQNGILFFKPESRSSKGRTDSSRREREDGSVQ